MASVFTASVPACRPAAAARSSAVVDVRAVGSSSPRDVVSRLSRPGRLKLTKAFQAVYRRGRWAHSPSLSVGSLANQATETRIGLRTKRGIKRAPDRNRLKRQVRGLIAKQPVWRNGFDVVMVIHPPRLPLTTDTLRNDLLTTCKRLGLLS